MRLFSERKRLREQAEREAASGQVFFTDRFDEAVRTKITYAFLDSCPPNAAHEASKWARNRILRSEGLLSLTPQGRTDPGGDLLNYLASCDDDMVPTVIEAMGLATLQTFDYFHGDPLAFRDRVNEILADHRVAYDYIELEMIPKASQELHVEVVAPALRLLSGKQGWRAVEQAYHDALEEIAKKPDDAITDAGTALQEAFRATGCTGETIGQLHKDARMKKLLAPHDAELSSGLDKIINWASTDRSELGDGHKVSRATADDAWLAVHVVGALILRLAGGPRAES